MLSALREYRDSLPSGAESRYAAAYARWLTIGGRSEPSFAGVLPSRSPTIRAMVRELLNVPHEVEKAA